MIALEITIIVLCLLLIRIEYVKYCKKEKKINTPTKIRAYILNKELKKYIKLNKNKINFVESEDTYDFKFRLDKEWIDGLVEEELKFYEKL